MALAALAIGVPTQAMAAQGFMFSKAGVTRNAYVADVSACSELAGGVDFGRQAASATAMPVVYPNTNAGAAGAALGLIVVALISRNPAKRAAELIERTCMADKGYVRIKVHPRLLRAIEREKDTTVRIDRFFAFASADHRGDKVLIE